MLQAAYVAPQGYPVTFAFPSITIGYAPLTTIYYSTMWISMPSLPSFITFAGNALIDVTMTLAATTFDIGTF